MDSTHGIKKVFQKFDVNSQPSDFAYWLTQPYEKRLAALEEIRIEYHRWKNASESRLQRVYRIIKQ